MIQDKEALDLIIKNSSYLNTEYVRLDQCLNRVASEALYASSCIPAFNRSAFDGFAFRAGDVSAASKENPSRLNLINSTACDTCATKVPLKKGTCIKVATGSQLPPGANAVAAQEQVKQANGKVYIFSKYEIWQNVAYAGEDIMPGTMILEKGTLIEPIHLGVLASLGIKSLSVYKVPRVAICSTGKEVVPLEYPLADGQIHDCNKLMLSAMVESYHGQPYDLGICRDKDSFMMMLKKAIEQFDMVITTGGVSVGDTDYVFSVLEEIGADILFKGIAIKPGSPMITATISNKMIFCLSGNPAAAYVTFLLFVRPSIQKVKGHNNLSLPTATARLEHDLPKNDSPNRFIRAFCRNTADGLVVSSAGLERPSILSTMIHANSLINLPCHTPKLKKGDKVDIHIIPRASQLQTVSSTDSLSLKPNPYENISRIAK